MRSPILATKKYLVFINPRLYRDTLRLTITIPESVIKLFIAGLTMFFLLRTVFDELQDGVRLAQISSRDSEMMI